MDKERHEHERLVPMFIGVKGEHHERFGHARITVETEVEVVDITEHVLSVSLFLAGKPAPPPSPN